MLQLAFVVALIEHTFDIYAYMDLIAYVRYLKIVKLLHNISGHISRCPGSLLSPHRWSPSLVRRSAGSGDVDQW
jgi:hypothetical protein